MTDKAMNFRILTEVSFKEFILYFRCDGFRIGAYFIFQNCYWKR